MGQIVDQYGPEMERLNAKLEQALKLLYDQAQEVAHAEVAYKKADAKATLEVEGTVQERAAKAMESTSGLLLKYRLSERMFESCKEAVRSRRAQISLLQSAIAAERTEAEFARTGPQ